jgi:DNA-binding GntR family transcriptional regulator
LPNSLRELHELLAAARAFTPMTPDELRALEARAKPFTDQVAGMYHQWP